MRKIQSCEKTLANLSTEISSARRANNSSLMKKIPTISRSFTRLINELKTITSEVTSVKTKFGINVARVPYVNGTINGTINMYVSANGNMYKLTTPPPISKMQAILVKLRAAHKRIANSKNQEKKAARQENNARAVEAARAKTSANVNSARKQLNTLGSNLDTQRTKLKKLRSEVNNSPMNGSDPLSVYNGNVVVPTRVNSSTLHNLLHPSQSLRGGK
jgi:hypothetical protein